MSEAEKLNLISIDDYLAGELISEVKHEYLGGVAYAMAGARNLHNVIAMNLTGSLFGRRRGKPCRPYHSDTKVRIQLTSHTRFYYPDAMVVCDSNAMTESFQDDPVVVAEVLSVKTRRTDEGEKKDAYLTIPKLKVYLLVEQESATVIAFRRTEQGFVREVYTDIDDVISLPEIETELPLAEIYDNVEFIPEPVEEDDH